MMGTTKNPAAALQAAIGKSQLQGQEGMLRAVWPSEQRSEDAILHAYGEEVMQFVGKHVQPGNASHLFLSRETELKLLLQTSGQFSKIAHLKRLNDIRDVNAFLQDIHRKLPQQGTFVGCAETQELRKARLLNSWPKGLKTLAYSLDFLGKRLLPKIAFTRRICMFFTGGKNQVMSEAEILGRLIYNGYEIAGKKEIGSRLYFVGRKVAAGAQRDTPTYGPLARLRRVGKDGKLVTVYKFRTMHPYSEYLQAYIHRTNKLRNDGGKFRQDFRITTLGHFFRRYWLDELPMVLNLLKGDIKLVGVRPISSHYFSLYSRELQEKRTQVKPGLIPPFYADMPQTLDEIIASELNYLEQYKKQPLKTDVRYFFLAFHNILFKKHRSH